MNHCYYYCRSGRNKLENILGGLMQTHTLRLLPLQLLFGVPARVHRSGALARHLEPVNLDNEVHIQNEPSHPGNRVPSVHTNQPAAPLVPVDQPAHPIGQLELDRRAHCRRVSNRSRHHSLPHRLALLLPSALLSHHSLLDANSRQAHSY